MLVAIDPSFQPEHVTDSDKNLKSNSFSLIIKARRIELPGWLGPPIQSPLEYVK